MIEIRDLLPRTHLPLRPLDLRLEAGEVVALSGPSGAGKTTLGRCIAGLHPKAAGEVLLDGERLGPVAKGRAHPVQYLYQDAAAALNPRWSVARCLAETGTKPDDRLAAGVEDGWLDKPAPMLSGGQAQRVALARALATRPRLLVCDEITAALDPVTQAALWHRLLPLARDRGMALIVITHDAALRARLTARDIPL